MTELELMANEEARHGNREALERLETERDAAYKRGLEDAAEMCADRRDEIIKNHLPVSAVNELAGMYLSIRAKIQENDG